MLDPGPAARPRSPMKAEEWRLRCELTDFYHLIDFLGWSEMIFNHISVRLPGPAHHYLVEPSDHAANPARLVWDATVRKMHQRNGAPRR